MRNIYNNEDHDKIQKDNVMETLNNIAESHSIKDQLLKKRSGNQSLENVSNVRREKSDSEDNSDGTFKISNFL
ncbi:hypothetical protein [Clostridium lacusfryxellense]|uniref:hypothetical protein n=1 Tax=Clostridium lacusfryxellense TaxID=205328 RepID=UPI001C0D8F91|nr:hypothetical protein [Clostridium lacusfryxellense]MBU3112989.1 hypothetical protein [Clostridium lacusfryxellense]